MLVFILAEVQSELHIAKRMARSLIHQSDALEIIILSEDFANHMNEHLILYQEPHFITLKAAYVITDSFMNELKNWLSKLKDHHAGIVVEWKSKEQIHHKLPFIWNTNLVNQTLGFSSKRYNPFEQYVLEDKMWSLIPDCVWLSAQLHSLHTLDLKRPAWMKRREEWSKIMPILSRSVQMQGCKVHPKVTVVICTYNAADYILWSIRSVLVQTYSDWELIIVNDGSEDDTLHVLSSLHDPRIRIITNKVNQGKSVSLNMALQLARGDWLLELDADDWLTPDCLAEMLLSLPCTRDPMLMYAQGYDWLEKQDGRLMYKKLSRTVKQLELMTYIINPTPLVPRLYSVSMLRTMGGWRTNDLYQGRLYEDIQMIIRIYKLYPIRHMDKPLYHRRLRVNSISNSHRLDYDKWLKWIEHNEL